MKYFILLILIACISCNHVKKITNRQVERSHFKEVQDKDSIAVSEDFTRLQHKYLQDKNKQLVISFFPKASASLEDSVRIIDSNGSMIIHMGANTPSALLYTAAETTAALKDSFARQSDSTVDKLGKKTIKEVETESKATDKQSDRVPWYLVVIGGLLIVTVFYLSWKFFSVPKMVMLVPLACIVLSSCWKSESGVEVQAKYRSLAFAVKVVTVDSCQYVVANTKDGVSVIHKQNCKYCLQRIK